MSASEHSLDIPCAGEFSHGSHCEPSFVVTCYFEGYCVDNVAMLTNVLVSAAEGAWQPLRAG